MDLLSVTVDEAKIMERNVSEKLTVSQPVVGSCTMWNLKVSTGLIWVEIGTSGKLL